MPTLTLMITEAGLDALVDAQAGTTDPIVISAIGLTNTAFVMAPTLIALPDQFKTIAAIAGQSASETIIHMVAQDDSADTYSARGLGLYLTDGTLFAVYSQADPIVTKVSIASFLIAVDVAFTGAVGSAIDFGDSIFLYPPATETTKGVAFLATTAQADAGVDATRIMTPALVKRVLDALAATLTGALTALSGRTILGAGLATGGGNLTANRTITVTAATAAELQAATSTTTAATPAAFGALPRSHGAVGYEVLPGGTLIQRGQYRATITGQVSVTVTLPVAFADLNYDLQLTTVIPATGDYDNFAQELSRTVNSFTIWSQDPGGGGSGNVAGFNWRVEGKA